MGYAKTRNSKIKPELQKILKEMENLNESKDNENS